MVHRFARVRAAGVQWRSRVSRWKSLPKIFFENHGRGAATGLPGKRWVLFRIEAFGGSGRTDFAEEEIAAFLAMPAGFRANAAMIVRIGVSVAFVRAKPAGEHAGVQLGVHEVAGSFGLSDDDAQSRSANVGAIQVRADATLEVGEVLGFAETRVGARDAGGDAGGEGGHGFGVEANPLLVRPRVITKHELNGFHGMGAHPAMRRRVAVR